MNNCLPIRHGKGGWKNGNGKEAHKHGGKCRDGKGIHGVALLMFGSVVMVLTANFIAIYSKTVLHLRGMAWPRNYYVEYLLYLLECPLLL